MQILKNVALFQINNNPVEYMVTFGYTVMDTYNTGNQ